MKDDYDTQTRRALRELKAQTAIVRALAPLDDEQREAVLVLLEAAVSNPMAFNILSKALRTAE